MRYIAQKQYLRYAAMLAIPSRVGDRHFILALGRLLRLVVDANQRAAEERGGVDAAGLELPQVGAEVAGELGRAHGKEFCCHHVLFTMSW